MIEALLIASRAVVWAFAVCLLFFTASSLWALWGGSQSARQRGRAHMALIACASMIAQPTYLTEGSSAFLLVAHMLTATSFFLALQNIMEARATGLSRRMDAVLDRPDLSLPLVELSELDAEAADKMAHEARLMIAARRAL